MNITGKKRTASNPTTRYLFTGEAHMDILDINPSREKVIEYKGLENIADRIKVDYLKIPLSKGSFTKINFLLSFDPSKEMDVVKGVYPTNIVIDYPIFISDRLHFNKDKTKVQLINNRNQSTWVKYYPNKSASELLDLARKDNPENSYIRNMDASSARIALEGEIILYQFLFDLTDYTPYIVNEKEPDKSELDFDNFYLGKSNKVDDISNVIKNIYETGDVSLIKEFVDSEHTKDENGIPLGLIGLLGIRINDDDPDNKKFYQEIYTNPNRSCIARAKNNSPRTYTTDENVDIENRLGSAIMKALTDPQYGWKHYWNNSTEFVPFIPSKYSSAKTTISSPANQVSDNNLPFDGGISTPDDDLPF